MRNFVFLIEFMLCALLAVSCGKTQRPDSVIRDDASNNATLLSNQINQTNSSLESYTNAVRDFTPAVSGGETNIMAGGAVLKGILPRPELTKPEVSIEGYLIAVDKFDQFYLDYLKQNKIQFGYYVSPNTLIVRSAFGKNVITGLKGVKSILPYHPFMKIASKEADLKNITKMKVTLWSQDDRKVFEDFCKQSNIRIISKSRNEYIVETVNPRAILFREEVLKAEKARNSEVFSVSGGQIASVLLGTNDLFLTKEGASPVSVYDVGIDASHPDIGGALKNVYDIAGDNNPGEFVSHGTHISGIIAGRGNLSAGNVKGGSPEASIYFFSMGDDLLGLSIPASMENLFDLSRRQGSFIANLSWGTYDEETAGRYLSISADIDRYVYEHPEFIVISAVGNNGKSIASPATAKNVISVGSLDGKTIASYSGRNYTDDGRVKPDICVQGSGIYSLNINGGYIALNGTSQSAAVLSGIVSRLSKWLKNRTLENPTQSMIRSLLTVYTTEKSPNRDTGYGAPVFNTPLDEKHLLLKRFRSIESAAGSETKFVAKSGDNLSFVLSWTDYPAYEFAPIKLYDDFDLEIVKPDGGIERISDRLNNSEKIMIENAVAGEYRVRIIRMNTPYAANDIALAVKSRIGFDAATEQNQNDLMVRDLQAVDSSQTGGFTTGTENDTKVNTGTGSELESETASIRISDNAGSTETVVTTTPHTAPVDAAKDYSDASSLLDGLSEKSTESASTVKKLFGKIGQNKADMRALGVKEEEVLSVRFTGDGIGSTEQGVPITASLTNGYIPVMYFVSNEGTKITGTLAVRTYGGETNSFPIEFSIDPRPPYVKETHPESGKVLTNTLAYALILDDESGLSSNFLLEMNGMMLSNNQFDYNFGTGKISLFMDRIIESTNRQDVVLRYLKVEDNAGNQLTNREWRFIYDPLYDNNPPDTPTNLHLLLSNKLFTTTWTANTEKDLAGYTLYLLDGDFKIVRKINNELLTSTNYQFFVSKIDALGLTAIDWHSNESEMAILRVGYEKKNYRPVIVFDNVPEKTNAIVNAAFHILEDGWLTLTNVLLDGHSANVNWESNRGVVTAENDGKHEVTVIVQDDDTNDATNTVKFDIDRTAPDAPSNFIWRQDGKKIALIWTGVSNAAEYRLYEGENRIITVPESTNYIFETEDYGKFYFSVASVDELGNESPKKHIIANTETGIVFGFTNSFWSTSQTLHLDVMVSTNRYEIGTMGLLKTDEPSIKKEWSFVRTHVFDTNMDLSGLPEGEYTIWARVHTDYQDFSQNMTFTLDKTYPGIFTLVNGQTNRGSYFYINSSTPVFIVVDDKNLARWEASFGDRPAISCQTNMIPLSLRETMAIEARAFDKAGNMSFRRIGIELDTNKPIIEIGKVDKEISATVRDFNLLNFVILTNGYEYYYSEIGADGPICAAPALANYELKITASDRAGNTNSVSCLVTNDQVGTNLIDEILVNGNTNLFHNDNQVSVSILGKLKSSAEFTAYKTNGVALFASGPVYTTNYAMGGLADEIYLMEARAGEVRKTRDAVIDTTAPAISIVSLIKKGSKLSEAVKVSDKNLREIGYFVDGRQTASDTPLNGERQEVNIWASDFADNTNSLTATVYTTEGNSGTIDLLVDLPAGRVIEIGELGAKTNSISEFASAVRYFREPVFVRLIGGVTVGQVYDNGVNTPSNIISNEGLHSIKMDADYQGKSLSSTFSVEMDYTQPSVKTGLKDGGVYSTLPLLDATDKNLKEKILSIDMRSWTNELPQGLVLSEGSHIAEIRAKDMAGNTNFYRVHFGYDKTPPDIFCTVPDGKVTSVQPEVYVNDVYPDVLEMTLDGQKWQIGYAIGEGAHVLNIIAVDRASNSNSKSVSFIYDSIKPQITLAVKEGYYREVVLGYEVKDENLLKTTAYLNGKTVAPGAIVRDEGDYEFAVFSDDKAGNIMSERVNFTIDRTDPVIAVNNILEGLDYSKGIIPDIVIDEKNLLEKKYLLDGLLYDGGPVSTIGTHTLEINAQDKSGNRSSKTMNFQVRENLPVVLLDGLNGVYNNGVYYHEDHFRLTAWVGNSQVVPLEIKTIVDGIERSSSVYLGEDGEYTAYAKAKFDFGGSVFTTTSPVYRVTVDKVKPKVSITGILSGDRLKSPTDLTFKAQDNVETMSLSVNGKNKNWGLQKIVIPVSEAGFTLDPLDVDIVSNNTLVAVATDILGRSTSVSLAFIADKDDLISRNTNLNTNQYADFVPPDILVSNYTEDMAVFNIHSSIVVDDENFESCQLIWSTNKQGGNSVYPFAGATNIGVPVIPLDFLNTNGEAFYEMRVIAYDKANNKSIRILHFAVDRTSPVIVLDGIADGDCVNSAFPKVAIFDPHFKTSSLYLDRVVQMTNFQSASLSIMNEGDRNIFIEASDSAGNRSELSVSFTCDQTPPTLTLNGITNGGVYRTDREISVSYYDDHIVETYISNQNFTDPSGDKDVVLRRLGSGNEKLMLTNELFNEIGVYAVDRANNRSVLKIPYLIDKTQPTITLSGIENGEYYNESNKTFTVNISDNLGVKEGKMIRSQKIGGVWTDMDTNDITNGAPFVYPADGTYSVRADVLDLAGNEKIETAIFTVDKILPSLIVIGGTNLYTNTNFSITVVMTDDQRIGDSSTFNINGTDYPLTRYGDCLLSNTFVFNDQNHYNIRIFARDQAHNEVNANRETYLDMIRPTVGINLPSDVILRRYFAKDVLLDTRADDNSSDPSSTGIDHIVWNVRVGTNITQIIETNQSFKGMDIKHSYPVTTNGSAWEGNYVIEAIAYDRAGNCNSNSASFTIDRTPPSLVMSKDTNDLVFSLLTSSAVIKHDIKDSFDFHMKSGIMDDNNFYRFRAYQDYNGVTNELMCVTNNNPALTNTNFIHSAYPFTVMRNQTATLIYEAEDFAGNITNCSVDYGYTYSGGSVISYSTSLPVACASGRTPGRNSDYTVQFSISNYAGLSKVVVEFNNHDTNGSAITTYAGFDHLSETEPNLYGVKSFISSNFYYYYINTYVQVSDVTTNTYTHQITTNTHYVSTNYTVTNVYYYSNTDLTRFTVHTFDIFNNEILYPYYFYVDLTAPIAKSQDEGNNIRSYVYDNETGIQAKSLRYDRWGGPLEAWCIEWCKWIGIYEYPGDAPAFPKDKYYFFPWAKDYANNESGNPSYLIWHLY